MNIAFDVDGVLTDLENFQINKGKNYFKNTNDINIYGSNIKDIFHCTKEEAKCFWTKYIWLYCLGDYIIEEAAPVIKNIKNSGDKVYIITSRAHTTEQGTLGKLFRAMLTYSLKKNNIEYDGIFYCSEENAAYEKKEVCKKMGIDVMVEDSVDNAQAIKSVSVVCLKNAKYNENYSDKDVIRIYKLTDLENQLENLRSSKKLEKTGDFYEQ